MRVNENRIGKERSINIVIEPIHDADPIPLSKEIIGVIRQTCDDLAINALMMPSGAGHDAQQIASFADTGMIFVPSVEGISHSPDEYTRMEDIALGTEVLIHVLLRLSGRA